MKLFKYSIIAKFIYRWANVPATFFMLIHLVASLIIMMDNWTYIFPATINAGIIYFLNRFYFKSYKLFPFKIEADKEKLICYDFMNQKKKYEILISDIDEIRGGIFGKGSTRPIYIHDGKNDVTIGMHAHIKDFNKLLTIILSNIKQELYDGLLDNVKNIRQEEAAALRSKMMFGSKKKKRVNKRKARK